MEMKTISIESFVGEVQEIYAQCRKLRDYWMLLKTETISHKSAIHILLLFMFKYISFWLFFFHIFTKFLSFWIYDFYLLFPPEWFREKAI